jgi:8-oxo-dGTP diphosphatase
LPTAADPNTGPKRPNRPSGPSEEAQFLAAYDRREFLSPLTTVDMAIFAIINHELNVLLIERSNYPSKGQLALPGGFIDESTDVDIAATAHRKLTEKTGVALPYLEQVETIGNATRDPRGWSVTLLHFALIDHSDSKPTEPTESGKPTLSHGGREPSRWVPVTEALATPLAFDHHELLAKALLRLRNKTRYTALPLRLMAPEFTLSELQRVFETVLGATLEKKSFRRRVLDAHIVVEVGEQRSTGHRPAALYRVGALPDDFVFPRPLEH